MKIVEVSTGKQKKEFHDLSKKLYKKDSNWTCPLDIEIESIFNPKSNKKFETGEARRWLLYDNQNKIIGRIAAFYDDQMQTHFKYPAGGCGFFECIDNQEAANILFDTASEWLISKGMKAMQGPVNFGENYNYWGLLVSGFVKQSYAMPYNFPYYRQLFENYGFQNYFEQYSYRKKIHGDWPERMLKFAEYIASRSNFTFEHFTYDRLDEFVGYFVEIYNTIWSTFHEHYSPLQADDIKSMMLDAKPVMDEELMWFAFDNGKPVAFVATTPDVHQILAKLKNGKLNIINKIKFLYHKKHSVNRARVFVGGAHPEYQNSGIIAACYMKLLYTMRNKKVRQDEIEMGWVGDYNKKMQSLYKSIDAEREITHITYLKLFDESIKFERFTNEFEGKLYEYQKK